MDLPEKLRSFLRLNKDQEQPAPLTEDDLWELEELLLQLDCGLEFTEFVLGQIKDAGAKTRPEAEKILRNTCLQVLQKAQKDFSLSQKIRTRKPKIIFVVGVNGSGKTTSIGKLAYHHRQQKQKVLIVPGDRFRAAAEDQLQMWAERAEADFFTPEGDKRADTVLFEAIQIAKDSQPDVLLVDTAGRLQNKRDLMQELARLSKVIDRHAPPSAAIERWLVIDASTGQNGYQQAQSFNESAPLSGIILSKFDGTAKGGILFAVAYNLKIPIRFLGVGEKLTDLQAFSAKDFIARLFPAEQ